MDVRRRFVIEIVLFVLFAVATVLTLVNGTWIESLLGVSPDGGSEATEWGIALGFAILAAASAVAARRDHRRLNALPR